MSIYVYQIQGALENENKRIVGIRVMVCTANYLGTADAPVEIFDEDTVAYLAFRLNICEKINIGSLPVPIIKKIRAPLGRWLDLWVQEKLYGDTFERKDTNH
jgi:hypothetical protein